MGFCEKFLHRLEQQHSTGHNTMRTFRRAILYTTGLILLAGLVFWQKKYHTGFPDASAAGALTDTIPDAASGTIPDTISGPASGSSADPAAPASGTDIRIIEYAEGNGSADPDISPEDLLKMNTAPQVALTFDDGPHSIYTKELLDGLAERDVKATFFLIGCNVEGKEDLIQRMAEEGHLIGSHTCSHIKLTDLAEDAALAEIARCNEIIESVTGTAIVYIRPPYGAWTSSWSDELNMQVVLWDVDPEDWKTQNTEMIVNHIVDHVSDGDIILLHDIYQTSVEAALQIVDILSEKGYQFARIDELLID